MNIAIVGTGYVGLVSGTCFAEMGVNETSIYKPGLEELILRNHQEVRSANLRYVLSIACTFGQNIPKYTTLVTKSTVPVGTSQKVKAVIREELDKQGVTVPFDVVSNPEFLKEGTAVHDFMSPDRIVVGVESERAKELMSKFYRPFY